MRMSFRITILFLCAENLYSGQYTDTLPSKSIMDLPMSGCIEEPASINYNEWTNYLEKSSVIDNGSLDTIPAGTYKILVQFLVDKDGKIGDVKIVEDPGYGLGKKISYVVSQFKGLWQPATLNGRVVRSYRRQPITFIVEEIGEINKDCNEPFPAKLIL